MAKRTQKSEEDLVNPLIKKLNPLLKNLQKGIAVLGIEGFSDQLNAMLNSNKNDRDRIIKIATETTCSFFNITKQQLLSTHSKGIIKDAKYTCACILHFEFKFTVRLIGRYIFKNKQFGFVALAIKRHRELNTKVKVDKEYKDNYDLILAQITEKIDSVK